MPSTGETGYYQPASNSASLTWYWDGSTLLWLFNPTPYEIRVSVGVQDPDYSDTQYFPVQSAVAMGTSNGRGVPVKYYYFAPNEPHTGDVPSGFVLRPNLANSPVGFHLCCVMSDETSFHGKGTYMVKGDIIGPKALVENSDGSTRVEGNVDERQLDIPDNNIVLLRTFSATVDTDNTISLSLIGTPSVDCDGYCTDRCPGC